MFFSDFGETFLLTLSFSAVFLIQNSVSNFFYFFSLGRRLLSDFIRKWGLFHRHDVHFPKDFGSRLKFQKTETRFCRWKSNDYNEINVFLSLENPCTFLLAKEKTWKGIFNTNSELSQNRTEKETCCSKQQ